MQAAQPAHRIGIAGVPGIEIGIHPAQKPAAPQDHESRDQADSNRARPIGSSRMTVANRRTGSGIMRSPFSSAEGFPVQPYDNIHWRQLRHYWALVGPAATKSPGRPGLFKTDIAVISIAR